MWYLPWWTWRWCIIYLFFWKERRKAWHRNSEIHLHITLIIHILIVPKSILPCFAIVSRPFSFAFFLFVWGWGFFLCATAFQRMVFLLSFWLVIVDIYFPLPQITKKLNAIFCIVCLPKKRCIFDISSSLNGEYCADPAWERRDSHSACRTSPAENYRVCVCVCVCVCVFVLHSFPLKKPPKEKLNNTPPLAESIKQLCPHVFLDLKVLYLNSFQIMSKKWCQCLYWQPQGALFISYYSHSFQGIFPVNIMKNQPQHTAGSLSLPAWEGEVFPLLPKRGKIQCKAEPSK